MLFCSGNELVELFKWGAGWFFHKEGFTCLEHTFGDTELWWWRCSYKYRLHFLVVEDFIDGSSCPYTLVFLLYKQTFLLTCHTDMAQWNLQVLKHRIEVGKAVVAESYESILCCVAVAKESFAAHLFVAFNQVLYHRLFRYLRYVCLGLSLHWYLP